MVGAEPVYEYTIRIPARIRARKMFS